MKRKKNVSGRKSNVTSQITHIVLNTGKKCEVPPGEFTSEAMRMFSQLVKRGGGLIPILEGTRVVIHRDPGCAMFVFCDCRGLPLMGIVVGLDEPGAANFWDYIKQLYHVTTDFDESRLVFGNCDYPNMPSSLPWLASYIYQPAYLLEQNCPEFMRCLAYIGQGLVAAMIELDIGCQSN